MSVVLTKRGEGELKVITETRRLATHTIQICQNEKVFPKRYRWCVTAKIIDNVVDIAKYVNIANSLRLDDPESAVLRKNYQNTALAMTYSLLTLMNIAYELFHINGDKMNYWTGLVITVQDLIRGWKKSDRDRVKGWQL